MSNKRIAIITGASAGLGCDYAREAENQFNLDEIWLVARRLEPMQKLAKELKKARGICLSLDLQEPAAIAQLKAKLTEESPQIILLVNNAGYGKIGSFQDLEIKSQLGEIDLNVRALTEITHMALAYMPENSYLLQVASSIGFAAAPNLAVYAATKAYVVSLSYALRVELAGRGIHVTAVCPGPVATEFVDVALSHAPGTPRRLTQSRMSAKPRAVVEQSFYDLKAGRAISVYGVLIRLFVVFSRIIPPSWMAALVARRP